MIQELRAVLNKGVNCLVEFEGGMGDQLMEAAAVLTAIEEYPKSSFSIRAYDSYLNILRRIPGIPQVENFFSGHIRDNFSLIVSTHTKHYTNPIHGTGGKASLYGSHLGLERVTKVAKIDLRNDDFSQESNFLSPLLLAGDKVNFMIHFQSRFKDARSWQRAKIPYLAKLIKMFYTSNIFVVGGPDELPKGLPDIIDLTGSTTWWQTCLLVSKMDCVICIDSGVMHLARSLDIPYVGLWGGTNPEIVLGEDEAAYDIRLSLDCRDLICSECQFKTNACMENITPDMVLEKINLIMDYQTSMS